MLSKKSIFFSFLLIFSGVLTVQAQDTSKDFLFWGSVVPNFKLTDKFSFKNEFHWRRSDFIENWMQFIVRPSVSYAVSKKISFTFGYTYANNYPYHDFSPTIPIPEHNLWEQVVLKSVYGKVKVTHQFRLENRWIGIVNNVDSGQEIDGFNFVNRFRYRLIGNFPITTIGETPVSFTLFNEVMITLTDGLRVNSVNQNWIVGLINFHLPKSSKISVGLQNQYILRGGGDRIDNYSMWLGLSKTFDLRKKETTTN